MKSEISYRGELKIDLISIKSTKLEEMKMQFNKISTSSDPIDFNNCTR